VWLKEWWEAKNFLRDHANELEEIHFDHYLGDHHHTGGQLFTMVATRKRYKPDRYPLLKRIYLHSSAAEVVEELMCYAPELLESGVEVIARPARRIA